MKELPEGYEEASKQTGALRRRRGAAKSPSDLMWLMLTNLAQGLTLLNTSALALASGLGKMSDVAFMKRLRNSDQWFKWILRRMASAGVADYLKPRGLEGYRVLAVDASDVNSGISRFAKRWHLHFALDIFTLACRQMKITGEEVGETLANFTVATGDLLLGDRAYGTLRSIAHCLSGGADFILRLKSGAFTMRSPDGVRIDPPAILKEAEPGVAVEIPVCVELGGHGLGQVQLRLCVLRKSEEQIQKSHERINRRDSKSQASTSEAAKDFNEHIAPITSLPVAISAAEVLGAYRYRWQIEMWFKRLKSLLGVGEIPKKHPAAMEAWLNGKMVLALLYEVLLSKLDFSPLGER